MEFLQQFRNTTDYFTCYDDASTFAPQDTYPYLISAINMGPYREVGNFLLSKRL